MIKKGIWIDNTQAVIVTLEDGRERMEKIYSGIEGRVRTPGEGKNYTRMGGQYFSFEKRDEEKRNHQLKSYFLAVTEKIKGASDLLVMGPASAKAGLEKELSRHTTPGSIKVITQGRLTDNQIAAQVRNFFVKKKPTSRGKKRPRSSSQTKK